MTNNFGIHNSVLAYDAEQFQFVADIRITSRDPSSIYVLSSKFHRFFLKNLEPTEVNTRLIRIYDDAPFNAKHTIVRNKPVHRCYALVGVICKTVENPFASFHTAKRPIAMAYRRETIAKYRLSSNENYHNAKLGDFNRLIG